MTKAKSNSRGAKAKNARAAVKGVGPNALVLLTADHVAVKDLFKKYDRLCKDDATMDAKERLAAQICDELTLHAQIEEDIFYPALREALDDDAILNEADVEHASAKDLIAQIRNSGADDLHFDAKVIVLGEYVDHHVSEEQGEVFRKARKAKLDLPALGKQMKARKAGLKAERGRIR
jgi:hypothetical protein